MAGMFVPKMVPELDPLKALQGIGKNIREGMDNRQRMDILSGIDPSDPNSLNEATSKLYATGSLDNIYLADRLGQAYEKREGTKYDRGVAQEDRDIERERVRRLNAPGVGMPGIAGIGVPGAPVSAGAGAGGGVTRPASPHSYLDADVPDEPATPTRPTVAPVQAEGAASMRGGRPPTPTSVLGLPAAPAQTPQVAPARAPGPAPVPVAEGPDAAPPPTVRPRGEQYAQTGPLPPPPPRPPVSSTGGRPIPTGPAAPATAPVVAPTPQAPPSLETQWQAFIQDKISKLEYAKTPGEIAKLKAQAAYGQTQIDALRAPQEASDAAAREQQKALYAVQAKSLGKMVETAGLRREELGRASQIGESLRQVVNTPNFPEHSPAAAMKAQQISRNFTQYAKSFGLDAVLPVDAVNAVIYNRTGGEGPQIANAYMQQLAGAILKSTVGSTGISNADREFVKEMQANPNMSRAAILRMVDIMDRHTKYELQKQRIVLESADEPGMTPGRLQGRLHNFDKLNLRNLRGQNEAPKRASPEGGTGTVGAGAVGAGAPPPAAVKALRDNPQRRDEFDAKFGKGAAGRILGDI